MHKSTNGMKDLMQVQNQRVDEIFFYFLNHNIKRKQIIVTKLILNKLQFTKLKQNNMFITNLIKEQLVINKKCCCNVLLLIKI